MGGLPSPRMTGTMVSLIPSSISFSGLSDWSFASVQLSSLSFLANALSIPRARKASSLGFLVTNSLPFEVDGKITRRRSALLQEAT